jgi:GT2 family glycosyltransferase
VREARAPLVAWLDADDVALPGRLAKQAAFLDAHPDVAVAGSWLELIDEKGRTLGYRCYPTNDAAIRAALPRFNPIPQPGVMARREALLAAGGYVERPDGVCEDYDLWCRLARTGARFANLPEPLTRYRIHLGAMKARKLRGTLRDSIRIKRRYYGGALGARGRLRLFGERALCLLPPRLVLRLFLALEARRRLPPAALATPPARAPGR